MEVFCWAGEDLALYTEDSAYGLIERIVKGNKAKGL